MWFALTVARDKNNARARSLLGGVSEHITTDHVVVETWLLLNSRYHRNGAERFWDKLRHSSVQIEYVTAVDLERAWAIGDLFSDQTFSVVDRTSFAVMERLGIARVASFDDDFAIYRFGRNRERAFEVLR
jgi:uncharacterized protein